MTTSPAAGRSAPAAVPARSAGPGFTLSAEQLQIIQHPLDCHGKVLSVAGSGKTTTMACRVAYLIEEHGFALQSIQVLMYNRDARSQFRRRQLAIGLPREQHPPVDTFHSYAYRLLADRETRDDWMSSPDRAAVELRQAIQSVLERRYPGPPGRLRRPPGAPGAGRTADLPFDRAGQSADQRQSQRTQIAPITAGAPGPMPPDPPAEQQDDMDYR